MLILKEEKCSCGGYLKPETTKLWFSPICREILTHGICVACGNKIRVKPLAWEKASVSRCEDLTES